MFKYKIDVLDKLKENGYSSYRLKKDKLIGDSQLQKIRKDEVVGIEVLNTLCNLLQCNIEDVIYHVPDPPKNPQNTEE